MTSTAQFSTEHVEVTFVNNGRVAIVSLNRPKKYNACSWSTFAQVQSVMKKLETVDVRAIVFNGKGKHFTAGLDLTSAMDL